MFDFTTAYILIEKYNLEVTSLVSGKTYDKKYFKLINAESYEKAGKFKI